MDTTTYSTHMLLPYWTVSGSFSLHLQVNRDPMAAQMQRMRNQIEQLQAELLFFRGDSTTPFEELQVPFLLLYDVFLTLISCLLKACLRLKNIL